MKKIIALALALIMALSMGSVAFAIAPDFIGNTDATGKFTLLDVAANEATPEDYAVAPGTTLKLDDGFNEGVLKNYKISYDFTTGANGYKGASYIESVKFDKTKTYVMLTIKESEKLFEEAKDVEGQITLTYKKNTDVKYTIDVDLKVNNNAIEVVGETRAKNAIEISEELWYAAANGNTFIVNEDGGYVYFTDGILKGVVKMDKNEKAFTGIAIGADKDTNDAMAEVLGDDYEAIVETYVLSGKGFKNEVAYSYDAYEEDPHFFYVWDGEGFTALDAKFNDDEDVMKYEFAYTGAGVLVVTDTEIVLAAEEETKNPDTGANDVVGVAAALAVVSLVAAGAVSLKK